MAGDRPRPAAEPPARPPVRSEPPTRSELPPGSVPARLEPGPAQPEPLPPEPLPPEPLLPEPLLPEPLLPEPLPPAFFARPVLEVARDLIGCTFLFDGAGGPLVEVEAYRADDPASHSYRGRTARNAVMFGPPGRLYVYFTYGMHFCVNLVCHEDGDAAAVLLRALEPVYGLAAMRRRRGLVDERQLCSGPAKLTQALGIGREHNGSPADVPPALVLPRPQSRADDPASWSAGEPPIVATPRIGIGSAADVPWRFVDAGSRFLSRRLPDPQARTQDSRGE